MATVYPSGVARATRLPAIVPPAPAVFSITTGWPSERAMRSPRMRAIVSVGPPAANGTTTVMGREGYAWAAAKVDIAASNAAPRICGSGDVFMTREFTGYARLRSRYGAFLIDVLFCLVLWFRRADGGSVGFEFNRWTGSRLLVAYFGLLPPLMQATPGKRAFNIRITDLEGKPLTVARSMARLAASIPSLAFLGLGFVVAAWTRRRQAAHDLVARTLVLEANAINPDEPPKLSWTARIAACLVVVSSAVAVYANVEIYHAILKREACMRGNAANADRLRKGLVYLFGAEQVGPQVR